MKTCGDVREMFEFADDLPQRSKVLTRLGTTMYMNDRQRQLGMNIKQQ